MPEIPELPDDLSRRLKAQADHLDAAAPPVEAAEARAGKATPEPRRRWIPLAAAVAVLATASAAWLLATGDDDAEQLILPADTTTTTSPRTTTTTIDWSAVPPIGIAESDQGGWSLFDLDGDHLVSLQQPSLESITGPAVVFPDVFGPDPIDPAEAPPGCSSAFGGGAVRVALCGGEARQPATIEVVDVTGSSRPLYERHPLDPTGTRRVQGYWDWALPSPDGRWVLAQWHDGECGDPIAVLVPVDGGAAMAVDALTSSASRGLGWASDGRAIVELRGGLCTRTSPQQGVFLRDPDSLLEGSLQYVAGGGDPAYMAYLFRLGRFENVPERMLTRALDELGFESCCGEPSHGGPDVTSGAVFEGAEIGVVGSPRRPAEEVAAGDRAIEAATGQPIQRLPLLHGEAAIVPVTDDQLQGPLVRFDCGAYTWTLAWHAEDRPEVDSMLLLAEALVPHLYCTLPAADPSG